MPDPVSGPGGTASQGLPAGCRRGLLRNPNTKGLVWYHGTLASAAQLAEGFRPTQYDAEAEAWGRWGGALERVRSSRPEANLAARPRRPRAASRTASR
jgi:hypothetical protein